MTPDAGKVLVIDNDDGWQVAMSSDLKEKGFHVKTVGSFDDALNELNNSLFHLVVIDNHLSRNMPKGGMELLRRLKQLEISEAIEKILITSTPMTEDMREAFKEHDVADFLSKDEYETPTFQQTVLEIFNRRVQANFNLEIILEDGLSYDDLAGVLAKHLPDEMELHRVVDEVKDLFCRLFFKANTIVLRPMSPGHGKTQVVRVSPFFETGPGESVVVKFGDHQRINQEYENYVRYVSGFLGHATTILNMKRTPLLGGIVYSLVGTQLDKVEDFASFYLKSSVKDIEAVLDNLFSITCAKWYAGRGRMEYCRLSEEYAQLLQFNGANLEEALTRNFPYYLKKEQISFRDLGDTLNKSLINPVYAILNKKLSASSFICTTHGDLNANNILIDTNKQTWLIDFYRTGEGHILRDCIELETFIKFAIMPGGDLKERYTFEEALLSVDRFSQVKNIQYTSPNEDYQKAFTIICKIRDLAKNLVNPDDDCRQYYIGLLFFSVNTIRFYTLPKVSRLHALMSAGMLCDKLLN